jgi:hypothetical protein
MESYNRGVADAKAAAEEAVPKVVDAAIQAEREACAAIARQWDVDHPASNYGGCIANLIEARGHHDQ